MQNDKPVVFSAKGVSKTFGAGKNLKTAVDNVTFDIYDEEFISIVGGSGCGKSVLAKIMLGLHKPTTGEFSYRGHEIKNLKEHWNEVQFVFQDPFGCFNQFFTIRSQLEDALNILKDKPSKEEMIAIARNDEDDLKYEKSRFLKTLPIIEKRIEDKKQFERLLNINNNLLEK